MKQIILFVLGSIYFLNAQAQNERIEYHFNELAWYAVANSNSSAGIDEKNSLSDVKVLQLSHSINSELKIDETDFSEAVLYVYGGANLFDFRINGDQLSNELDSDDFFADITSYVVGHSIEIQLIPKQVVEQQTLAEIFQYAQISLISGVSIRHFQSKDDPFFGGKLVDVKVKNFMDRDVDGKLIVRIIDGNTWDDVGENNNCAFSRAGSEIGIEINFPNESTELKDKKFLVNVSMVDKENGEDVIDELLLPITF